MATTPYLIYEIYDECPSCVGFVYGEQRAIVLRNLKTGKLERIRYKMSGAVMFETRPGYHWFWGDICDDAALVFNFASDGKLEQIVVSFCGKSASVKGFEKEVEKAHTYPAEFTAIDYFSKK